MATKKCGVQEVWCQSYEANLGINAHVYEGWAFVKGEVGDLNFRVGRVKSSVCCLEPIMETLCLKVCEMEQSLSDKKRHAIQNIVEVVLKAVAANGSTYRGWDTVNVQHPFPEEKGKPVISLIGKGYDVNNAFRHRSSTMQDRPSNPIIDLQLPATEVYTSVPNMDWPHKENMVHCCKPGSYKPKPITFPSAQSISKKDSNLLTYLFRKNGVGEDKWSEEVARCGDFGLSRIEIQCLSRSIPLSFKVINILAAYLYETDASSWFFPTFFGERAKLYEEHSNVHGWVASTITICRLQRFHRRLRHCSKALIHKSTIFIPLHDHVSEHWFLLVMNLVEQHAELWDNMPDIVSMDRRKAHAGEAILLLQNVFANEMTKSSDVYYHFPSFNVNIPELNPTHNKSTNSGIYVIRHMQQHGSKWFTGFNPDDHRILLALQIVNHPRNEVINSVKAATSSRIHPTGSCPMSFNPAKVTTTKKDNGSRHPNQMNTVKDMKAPSGRKCRSHRLRRGRA